MRSSRRRSKQRRNAKSASACSQAGSYSELFLLPPVELSDKPSLLDPPDLSPDVLLSPIHPSTAGSISQPSQWIRDRLFKTKVCRYFIKGRCKYGDACTYAHWSDELQPRPDLHKTRICNKLDCTAETCPFAHSIYELRDPPMSSELAPCRAFLQGRCDDSACPLAHNKTMIDEIEFTTVFRDTSKTRALSGVAPMLALTASPKGDLQQHPASA
ncbi:hypothetical protein FOZ61_011085 [Perkinsus olseni]|uniref:C3H1-type domain-containing protein n=1 Tax=Perkinsus olseni TaxID=32597 RepID=A0A7J6KY86_PEROL|nr:hypothetical protein FOZ61_011085 [Perkinsus olseni]KAF4651872.1 hypothetical protein FOL46_010011 [Perkinsus olseni]